MLRRGGIEVQMSTRSSQKIYLPQCCFRRSIQRFCILVLTQLISTEWYGICILRIFFQNWPKLEMMTIVDLLLFATQFACRLCQGEFTTENSWPRLNFRNPLLNTRLLSKCRIGLDSWSC
uniref:Uncharacterized protein n=1 Tax=Salix viminalis TaxID=40686 RepID=A0A6N2NL00_SALVM